MQVAARERGLEHVGGVDRTFCATGTHQRVQFVDEEDDRAARTCDLLEDGFEPLLEFAAVLRTREQCAHVERHDALVLEALGYIPRDDAVGEPLDDGGLAHTRIADQHRVVLAPTGQHLHHAADLGVPANDGVELAFARILSEVACVLREGIERGLGVGARHLAVAAHLREGGVEPLAGQLARREEPRDLGTPLRRQSEQKVLGRQVAVAQALGCGARFLQRVPEGPCGAELTALRARQLCEQALQLGPQDADVHVKLPKERRRHTFALVDQRQREVRGGQLGMSGLRCEGLSCLEDGGGLGRRGELVVHVRSRPPGRRTQDARAVPGVSGGQNAP